MSNDLEQRLRRVERQNRVLLCALGCGVVAMCIGQSTAPAGDTVETLRVKRIYLVSNEGDFVGMLGTPLADQARMDKQGPMLALGRGGSGIKISSDILAIDSPDGSIAFPCSEGASMLVTRRDGTTALAMGLTKDLDPYIEFLRRPNTAPTPADWDAASRLEPGSAAKRQWEEQFSPRPALSLGACEIINESTGAVERRSEASIVFFKPDSKVLQKLP